MKRGWLWGLFFLVAAGVVTWLTVPVLGRIKPPIKVGILHSRTGSMAISEASMIDADVLALEEINAQGGLLGRRVDWVVVDCRSDPATYAREAERLIAEEKVSVLFGCYSSSSRKSVKPVVERANHLLIYPVAYEGLEQSPNIIYTGAAPNQQIVPTVTWCTNQLNAKSFFLVGSDDLWPRAVHAIIKDQLSALGAKLVGEEYLGADGSEVDALVTKAVSAEPDVILSTIVGDANVPFYKRIRGRDSGASKISVVSFIVAEDELRELPVHEMTNDYAVCNYFQNIDRAENARLIKSFKARFGQDRVLSDSIVTAYNSVNLWAQAVRESESAEPADVGQAMLRQSLNAPEGVISVDRESRHTWRPFFVGKVRPDAQFEVVWSVVKPIRPVPFPFSRTREEWESFLDNLYKGWGGNWSPPAGARRS
jgi:urea transport system substrate-binding protein